MLKLALLASLWGCVDLSESYPDGPPADDPPVVSTCDWTYWYENLAYSTTRACTVLWPWAYWGTPWPSGSAQVDLARQTALASPVWRLHGRDGVLVVNANDGSCIFSECIDVR